MFKGLLEPWSQNFMLFIILRPDPCFDRLDLVIELLGWDARLEKFFTISDAPEHLTAVIIQLFVELGYVVIEVSFLLRQVLLKLCKSFAGEARNPCFSLLQVLMELHFLNVLNLGFLKLVKPLLGFLFEFSVFHSDGWHYFQFFYNLFHALFKQRTVLCIKLFFKEARVVEFESMRSFAECLRDSQCDSAQIHAHHFLTCSLFDILLELKDATFLAMYYKFELPKVVLQVVNINIDREESIWRYDCFNFRNIIYVCLLLLSGLND